MKPFEVIRNNLLGGVYPSLSTSEYDEKDRCKFFYDVEKECLSLGLGIRISKELAKKAKDLVIIYFYDLEDVVKRVASFYYFAIFVINSKT